MSNLPAKQLTVSSYLNQDQVRKHLDSMLKERAGQFITSLVSLSNLTKGLEKCDPKTLLYCGLKAASMDLPLDNNLGFAYAVPYGQSAQFQIGYRGLIQLAQRTGQYKSINVIEIRAGELENWDVLNETLTLVIIEDVEKREKQPVVGYVSTFELINGFRKTVYWSRAKVEAHGKRFSKTYNNGPWKSDFDAMAKKTVLKELLSKWGPLSIKMQEAIKFDQAVIRKDEETGEEIPDYMDADFSVVDDKPTADDLTDEVIRQMADADGQMSMDGDAK